MSTCPRFVMMLEVICVNYCSPIRKQENYDLLAECFFPNDCFKTKEYKELITAVLKTNQISKQNFNTCNVAPGAENHAHPNCLFVLFCS